MSIENRLKYTVDSISSSLYESSQQIKKVYLPSENTNKMIWISDSLISSLTKKEEYEQLNLSSKSTSELELELELSNTLNNSLIIDGLKTPREDYCILRIWKKDKLESRIII